MTELLSNAVPPASVLKAFGLTGAAAPLVGGQGRTVRVGEVVLKPVDGAEDEVEWVVSVLENLPPNRGFRVPGPIRAADGRCIVEGWTASEFLVGEPGPQGRWSDVLSAGRTFHAVLRELSRPDFLDRRMHPWAVADRVAWGEQQVDVVGDLAEPLAALLELRRPVAPTAQLVHGDLTGNVLFAAGQAPAVIDFSPYWRPPVFAEAIVVADGLLWFEPPPDMLVGSDRPDWQQMLIRALIFRLVAHSEGADPSTRAREDESARYVRATKAVVGGLR